MSSKIPTSLASMRERKSADSRSTASSRASRTRPASARYLPHTSACRAALSASMLSTPSMPASPGRTVYSSPRTSAAASPKMASSEGVAWRAAIAGSLSGLLLARRATQAGPRQ